MYVKARVWSAVSVDLYEGKCCGASVVWSKRVKCGVCAAMGRAATPICIHKCFLLVIRLDACTRPRPKYSTGTGWSHAEGKRSLIREKEGKL